MRIKIMLACGIVLCQPFGKVAISESGELTTTPDKCVSLRKGQVCYQRIRLDWRAPVLGSYCIVADTHSAPLKCWEKANSGHVQYSFESARNVHFSLYSARTDAANSPADSEDKTGKGKAIANSLVSVAWVYNSTTRRRTSWRLF